MFNTNFEAIYHEHRHLVFNLCLHYLQNQQDAEEAAQDVFVKIHAKMGDFEGKSSLKTWVYRIAVNHCLDVLRTRKRKHRLAFITNFQEKRKLLKSMRVALFAAIFTVPFFAGGQNFILQIQPVFSGKKFVLEKPIALANADSLTISTLKFYLGNFEFWKNGQVVFSEKTYRLLDLEDEKSLSLRFKIPDLSTFQKLTNLEQPFDSLAFDLGTDSLTNVSGAMGGDLDPTRGMFWTWQSGYINLKIEGFSSKCLARNGFFEFHLGGFAAPFQTVRQVKIKNVGRFFKPCNARLDFDLAPFFEKIDWVKKPGILSPCAEAAAFSGVLAKSFSVHVE